MPPEVTNPPGDPSPSVLREVGVEILRLLNEMDDEAVTLRSVISLLKTRLGFAAVGIRLQRGEDYPYYTQEGFSADFLRTENSLVVKSKDGGLCRNPDGSACLECTCGLVISGQTDPANTLFTPGGSCWTSDSFPLLDLPADADPRLHPRNRCIHKGYASVALVPIRDKTRIVGLLQLNDHRKGRFTLETVTMFEGIAAHIGTALMRKQAEAALQRAHAELEQRVLERTEALRQANQELHAASRYARNLLEASLDPLVTISADGKITDVNAATEKVTGLSREQLNGRDFADCFTEPERARAGYKQAFAEGRTVDYPLSIRHASGAVTPVLYNAAVYRDERGEVVGLFAAARDITLLKRAEAEREKLEAQTRQLQKAESLGRMAGAVAHLFNNQLQAVMLSLEMAGIHLGKTSSATAGLTEAMQSTRKAAEVSRLILTYLGQAERTPIPVDLSELCRQGLPLLQTALPRSHPLELSLPAAGPVVSASPSQLQQVLANLLTNACEASGETTDAIRVSAGQVAASAIPATGRFPVDFRPAATAYGFLEVADSGVGIAAAEIEMLFDPFYSTKFVGRGMGLPVVLGIVRTHGGAVVVESQPNRGSVFRVYFPALAEIPARPLPPAPPQARTEGGTVLVVEDEPTVRRILKFALTGAGFKVIEAADGLEAVEKFRQQADAIGCVVSDLSMPRLDGWGLLGQLRQLAPDIPVILVSGYSESEAMAGEHPERPQAFLHKPFESQALINAIRQFIRVKPGA